MEKIREKLNTLRVEADAAVERAEKAEAENKKLQQLLLEREQDIKSLTHQLDTAQADVDKLEAKLAESKIAQQEGEYTKNTSEGLVRKVQLLEEELDTAEKNLKETTERLRQVDVKAEHFERQITGLEREREDWEKKYEASEAKYHKSKGELDELLQSMESI